jgi:pimeloyl-ACP methyl ester carboxylesterase
MDIKLLIQHVLTELKSLPQTKHVEHIRARLGSVPEEDRDITYECILAILQGLSSSKTKTVIALIHGIRTNATWQEQVKDLLDKHDETETYPIGYGYLDVIRFLCPRIAGKKPIERVLQELRGIRMKHRNDKICVIAHSFGTYIISKILLKHPDVQVDRLLLCGSVVPENYRWDNIASFPSDGVVNDCGSKDIWPILAKCVSLEYGASGTFGFKTFKVTDRYHNFEHSDFFEKKFITRFWVPFVLEAKIEKSKWLRPTPSWWKPILPMLPVKTMFLLAVLYFTRPFWWSMDIYPMLVTLK